MKYANIYGMNKHAVIPILKPKSILPKALFFFQLFFATAVLSAQCVFPVVTPACTNLAVLETTEADLTGLVCDGSTSSSIDVAAGGLYRITIADGNSYSFSLVPSGNNTTDPIFPGVMDLFHNQGQTIIAATSGPVAASAGTTPTTMSYLDNPGEDNELFLRVMDKSCAGNWKDYTLTITCTTCTISSSTREFVAANEAGCVSAAYAFPAPTISGVCDNTSLIISDADGTGATLGGGMVIIPEGLAADIYTIEFEVENCSDMPFRSTTEIVVEPTSSCSAGNVTLSSNCTTAISPSVILSNQCAPDHQYTVFINGVQTNTVDAIGTYEVSVRYTPTVDGMPGSALNTTNPFFNKELCWQNITFEDKTGPACNLAQADREYNFVCGFETATAVPTFTDCSGTATANPVQEVSIGVCGNIDGVTDEDNDLFDDFMPTGFIQFMGMSIPAPSEAEATTLQMGGFALERIIKRTFSATDGNTIGSSCDQFIYIWRPTAIISAERALITCGLATTPTALAAIDPQLVPHYANPLYDGSSTGDSSTANDFSATNVQDPSFVSTKVDDAGNPQFVAIAGQDHTVCGFIVTNEDGTASNPCGNTTKLIRRYTVLNCCTNEIIIDNVSQYIETIDNVAPVFSNCPTGTEAGTIGNPREVEITQSNTCALTVDFSTLRPTATDACSTPITYNASYFELADDFTGAGTFVTSGMMPSLEKGSYRVEVTATDDCGNISDVCNVYLRVEDRVVPVVTCSINAVSVDGNGNAEVCAATFASATDNCGTISNLEVRLMEQDESTFADCINVNCTDAVADANGNMVFNLVFRATDACANTNISMCPAELQIKTTPTFTCPPDVDVECTDFNPLTGVINGVGPTIGGLCGQMFTTRFEDATLVAGACGGTGTITRTHFLVMNGVDLTSCTQTINIVDNTPPVFGMITSPLNVECSAIPTGTEITATDMCPEGTAATVTFVDASTDGSCTDEYTITRTFTATDACGNSVTATQTINVSDNTAPTFGSLPANDVVSCSAAIIVPTVTATDNCDTDVTLSLSETNVASPTCPNESTITRTWTATDNCGNSAVHTQVVTVTSEPITVTFPADRSVSCDMMEGFTIENPTIVASPCNGTNPMIEGPMIGNPVTVGNNITQTYTFTVTDDCGFSMTNTTTVTFENCCVDLILPNPGIECSGTMVTITVGLPGNNSIITDFTYTVTNQGSTVTQQGNNVFNFIKDLGTTEIYNIVVVPNDPNIILCNPATAVIGCFTQRIAGRVFNEEFESIEDVEVELMNTEIPMSMTNIDGEYAFDDLSAAEYTVTAHKENDPANGLTTFDLVVMTQHVLGINTLDTPYKLIAADVNMDEIIDIRDMLELRQLILYAIDDFTVNESWRFIDADYVFPDPQNPWTEAIPSARTMEVGESVSKVDFIAVKIGDLDCSARTKTALTTVEERSEQTLVLNTKNNTIKAGAEFEVVLRPSTDVSLSATQFTIDFDPSLAEFNGVSSEALSLNNNSINMRFVQEGLVPFAWSTHADQTLTSATDVVLTFTAKQDLTVEELLQIDSELTPAMAYSSEGKQYDVQLNIQEASTTTTSHSVVLHQNQPNPFLTNTTIGFEVSDAQSVSFTVFDIDGKLLYTRNVEASTGYNSIEITSDEIAQRGVMFYQLNTADYSVTKKMIILE